MSWWTIEVDVAGHVLTRGGQAQPIEPKAFSVLVELLRHAGETVGRDQLLDAVWGHRHVTPGVLTRAIAQARASVSGPTTAPAMAPAARCRAPGGSSA